MESAFIIIIMFFLSSSLAFAESSDTEDLLDKGREYMALAEYEKALTYFDKVLELEQDNVKALINKGSILFELDKLDEAVYYYDRALEIDPNNKSALYNKGNFFIRLGYFDDAIPYFKKVLEIDPNHENALEVLDFLTREFSFIPVDGILEVIIRDSNQNLVGYIKTNEIRILDHKIATEYVQSWPVKQIITRDGKNYQVHQYEILDDIKRGEIYGIKRLSIGDKINIFIFAFHYPNFSTMKGDTVTSIFKIFSPVDQAYERGELQPQLQKIQ